MTNIVWNNVYVMADNKWMADIKIVLSKQMNNKTIRSKINHFKC